ncbi:MAG: family 20 glycosylhydrolase [Candidatus Nanopelagicales bacterium]
MRRPGVVRSANPSTSLGHMAATPQLSGPRGFLAEYACSRRDRRDRRVRMCRVIPSAYAVTCMTGQFVVPAELTVAVEPAPPVQELPALDWMLEQVSSRAGIPVRRVRADEAAVVRLAIVSPAGLPELREVPLASGLPPFPRSTDERYQLTIAEAAVDLRAFAPAGLARGLAAMAQLVSSPEVPAVRILDGPRFAWRGLSLDVVRHPLGIDEIKRVVDLLWTYRLSVLHLHLTDDEGWRIAATRPGTGSIPADQPFSDAELRSLVEYAAERHVQVVPEFDTPGHTAALMQLHPELISARNQNDVELSPGLLRRVSWLDPAVPATELVIAELLEWSTGIFPGPYLHIGGDEPWGMPSSVYTEYITWLLGRVRATGKVPIGWQEIVGVGLPAGQVIQYWISPSVGAANPDDAASLEQVPGGAADLRTAVTTGLPIVVSPHSHCYLDVPYADEPGDERSRRLAAEVGASFYERSPLCRSFDWEPVTALGAEASEANVAGVEAALWAETIRGFEDACFLLLPRLTAIAERAWSPADSRTWEEHQTAVRAEEPWWDQQGFAFFRPAR